MRSSEFWTLVEDEFGPAHGRTLVRDHVLPDLQYRTAERAIADGEGFREVWFALCTEMEVPHERRWGKENLPRRRR